MRTALNDALAPGFAPAPERDSRRSGRERHRALAAAAQLGSPIAVLDALRGASSSKRDVKMRQRLRRWHIWLGWIVGLPFLAWTVSGLVMVARPIETVRGEGLIAEAPPLPSGLVPGRRPPSARGRSPRSGSSRGRTARNG